MTCPCNLCEERFVGCHAKCETYNAWKAEIAEQKERNGVTRKMVISDWQHAADLRWHKRRRGHR